MHLPVLAAFAAALAVAVALPGPGIFSVVSCALGRGLREALAWIAGLIVGDLIYFYLAVFGLAALARTMGELFVAVKFAGAVYLIWLGVQLWRTKPVAMAETAKPGPRSYGRALLGGFLVTISNPKTIVFYAGLLPTFIDLPHLTRVEALVMGAIVVATVGLIPAAYAVMAAGSRRFLQRPERMKILNRTAGSALIGTGVAVVTR